MEERGRQVGEELLEISLDIVGGTVGESSIREMAEESRRVEEVGVGEEGRRRKMIGGEGREVEVKTGN